MKRFIITILCVLVFFIGLGNLLDKVGAKFKSDERALELIKQARQAIGGDAAISGIRSMTITGNASHTFETVGEAKTEQGEIEMNLQLPNQFSKTMKFGTENGETGEQIIKKDVKIVVVGKDGELPNLPADGAKRVVVTRKGDGDNATWNSDSADGNRKIIVHKDDGSVREINADRIVVDKNLRYAESGMRQNELFRTTFALLLSAPEGLDVNYVYAGAANVDGFSCDVVEAQTGGSSIKLYLDQSTHLPRMISYQDMKPFIIKINKDENAGAPEKDVKVFVRQPVDFPKSETAEFQLKFSDFRSVNGVQLPYKWTKSVGGNVSETIDITNYEINPANIADKFKEQKVFVRTLKSQ